MTFRSRLDVVSDPMETCTPRFLDPKPLLMPRCSEPSWCLAKHGSDKGMPKKLRAMVLCSQRCGPAEICCILHPCSNAEGFLQAVSKGFFPVRCVLVLIQGVSGSRHSASIAWPLRGAEVWSSVGSQSQFFARLEPGLPVNALHKAAAPACGGAQQEPGAAAPAEQDAATGCRMSTTGQSCP